VTARPSAGSSLHPDPYRSIDAQTNADTLVQALELRGRTASQARLRRRFLDLVRLRPGERVLEVGCGSGVVLRDVAVRVGRRGQVVGVDSSRRAIEVARELSRRERGGARVTLRVANGLALPFRAARFDVALAVTVVLHVAEPETLVREMLRTLRPGGRIGLQDQDFGTLAVTHPDRELTDRILRGVVWKIYEEPYSGRRLPGLLREAGAADVRLRTEVFQDTDLEPYTKAFLERRAELAVRFGIVDATTAQHWLDGFTALVAAGEFVMTLNFYGAVGVKPGDRRTVRGLRRSRARRGRRAAR
jgi:ubiquinone/menaquinone biosynthesis C-methylase UbiE